MNARRFSFPPTSLLVLVLLLITGCRTVDTGPSLPPDPDAQNVIYGQEPEPAPIPQKDVPEGESSLSHKKPDKRID